MMSNTGIAAVDEWLDVVARLGLESKVTKDTRPATYYKDGRVMIPESTCVLVKVSIPVPEEMQRTLDGLDARNDVVNFSYSIRSTGRSRGRFSFGERSSLYGIKKINSPKQLGTQLRLLSGELKRLERRVASERAARNR